MSRFQLKSREDTEDLTGPFSVRKLEDLVAFFQVKGVPVEVLSSARRILENAQGVDRAREARLSMCRDFKAGKFNSSAFASHVKFLNQHVTRKLKEHQVKATFHLYLAGSGANFSVPGSGKTTVVLSVYEMRRLAGEVNSLFVVGPVSCFRPWIEEFRAVLGREPTYLIQAGGRASARKSQYYRSTSSDLILTSFQTLMYDQDEVRQYLEATGGNVFLVIDEAHYIKQIGGNWADAVLSLADLAKFRCILTGTPMPRAYGDVYNMFKFLCPDRPPLDNKALAELDLLQSQGAHSRAKGYLDEKIGPYWYRVRKSELGLSAPLFHEPYKIRMNEIESELYQAIVSQITSLSRSDYLRNAEVIGRLKRGRMVRLRQALSYAGLLRSAVNDYPENLVEADSELAKLVLMYDTVETPAKIDALLGLVEKIHQGRCKVVIWSNFVGTLALILRHLSSAGYSCEKIEGRTPTEKDNAPAQQTREDIIATFKDPESPLKVLIANPAACSEAISLHTACHHAVYYDLSYNCAQYLQSLDRIHRVGGSEIHQAHYYFLQYAETIEEDILANLTTKASRMTGIIDSDYGIYESDIDATGDEESAYTRLFCDE